MDALNNAGLGARRNEDIALDLLKFVAGTVGVGRPAARSLGLFGARLQARGACDRTAGAVRSLPQGG